MLHGYGVPRPEDTADRNVVFTNDTTAYALDTSHPGVALLSVPVFCSHLVERIAAAVPELWDSSLTSVSRDLLRIGRIHLLPPSQPGSSSR